MVNIVLVTHNSTISYGTNYLDVEVIDSRGNPVFNAQVSLLVDNDDIATNLFTDNLGRVTIPLNPNEAYEENLKKYEGDNKFLTFLKSLH